DRVLGETSVASDSMDRFGRGEQDVNDSSFTGIKEMIETSGSACALVLPIDEGKRWWSTRLFLLGSLLRSLTAVRQVVFCDAKSGRFVGMATPSAIVDGLAAAFPDLDLFAQELRRSPDPPSTDIEREGDRQMNAWRNFIRSDLPKRLESNLKVGVRPPL